MEKDTEKRFNENQVEGRNAVLEVFKSGRDIEKIIVVKLLDMDNLKIYKI